MDLSLLRERRASEFSVSELNLYIKNIFEADRQLNAVSVRGEISNFTYHKSGHLYFSLKDDGGQVKAVMFKSSAARLKFMPENGMKVIVRCSVSVYVQSGAYQLYVTSMQPDGIGALYLAYEQLKAKLESEGLFLDEHKKIIPAYPEKIGVITSPTGAAIRDIINVIGRRYPLADIYLYPSLVQGDEAEENLISALDYFDRSNIVDVIILGRGGGSIEDLWAFNGEKLARKIYQCRVPIISAVGHETDFTIADFVSDLRAPTPSAAAEISVPDQKDLYLSFSRTYDRVEAALKRTLERAVDRLDSITNMDIFSSPKALFADKVDILNDLRADLLRVFEKKNTEKEHSLGVLAGKLHVLSPLATLSRGYAVAYSKGMMLKSIDGVSNDDIITVKLNDGNINASVIGKEKNNA